jgi:two-component system OmpR family sensor kinase
VSPLPPRRSLPLAVRLTALYALLVAATLLVVIGVTSIVVRSHLDRQVDAQLLAAAASFGRGPAAHADDENALLGAARAWLAEQPVEKGDMAAVRVGGRVLSSTGDLDLFEVANARQLLTTTAGRWWNLSGREGDVRGLTIPLRARAGQVGTLVLLAYKERVVRTLASVLRAIGWASAIGIGFAALLGFAIVRRSLRPLARITRQVDAVEATGDLSGRVAMVDAGDEVGRLAAAFDRMLARLQLAFGSQQRLVADVAHELRTPLTVARGQLELLGDELESVDQRRSFAVATGELDRMARIVDDLLLLARLDEGLQLAAEPVEVDLVLREALLRAMLLEPRDFRVDAQPGLYALADPERLLQALTNLVKNAVEHTPADAAIALSAAAGGDRVLIRVADTGPGIPAHDLPHVFERLYRGSHTRGRPGGGAGLGLAITASLVEAMHGTIEVASAERAGTTFTIALRAAEVPPGTNVRQVPVDPPRSRSTIRTW